MYELLMLPQYLLHIPPIFTIHLVFTHKIPRVPKTEIPHNNSIDAYFTDDQPRGISDNPKEDSTRRKIITKKICQSE